jgi:hypothetical protein
MLDIGNCAKRVRNELMSVCGFRNAAAVACVEHRQVPAAVRPGFII